MSIIGIAVLLVLVAASVRMVRAQKAEARLEADTRTDSNVAQHERSIRQRAQVRADHSTAPAAGADATPPRPATLD